MCKGCVWDIDLCWTSRKRSAWKGPVWNTSAVCVYSLLLTIHYQIYGLVITQHRHVFSHLGATLHINACWRVQDYAHCALLRMFFSIWLWSRLHACCVKRPAIKGLVQIVCGTRDVFFISGMSQLCSGQLSAPSPPDGHSSETAGDAKFSECLCQVEGLRIAQMP